VAHVRLLLRAREGKGDPPEIVRAGHLIAVERETVNVAEQDPEAISNIHIQTLCKARWDDGAGTVREGVGILEQLVLGPHEPTGLTGFTDGYSPS